jgi:NAD(P)-dependent dehydrogenase (short-subunit alcohol dehydrogenase family)
MNRIVLFGGSGGLGSQLKPKLDKDYKVISLSSKDVDVTNYNEVRDFFVGNDIDIVINLSGYNYNSFLHKYGEDNIVERYKQIDVNIIGSMNILTNCLPQMRERNFGRIILISSILSSRPVAGTSVYSGCKAFIDNLVKTCSIENLSKGITCNSLQLGYMDGGLVYEIPTDIREKIKESIPLKRWGNIIELENSVRYLINTEYVSGCSLKINGGLDF